MVHLCPVFKWWPENQTEKSLCMVQNVQYSNGPPSHMTFPFEYRTHIMSGIQMDLVFKVRYSDGYCDLSAFYGSYIRHYSFLNLCSAIPHDVIIACFLPNRLIWTLQCPLQKSVATTDPVNVA